MRIFVAHAKADSHLAKEVAVKLHARGFKSVFLDEWSLPPGHDYDARIRAAIGKADLFLYILTLSSIRPEGYALNELQYARLRWPNPAGRVLTVMPAPGVDLGVVSPYLTAVTTILRVEGNAATMAADGAWAMAQALRRRRKQALLLIAPAVVTTGIALTTWLPQRSSPTGQPKGLAKSTTSTSNAAIPGGGEQLANAATSETTSPPTFARLTIDDVFIEETGRVHERDFDVRIRNEGGKVANVTRATLEVLERTGCSTRMVVGTSAIYETRVGSDHTAIRIAHKIPGDDTDRIVLNLRFEGGYEACLLRMRLTLIANSGQVIASKEFVFHS